MSSRQVFFMIAREKVVYKIRNKQGFYSTGGMAPEFNATGKSWTSLGHIKSHFKQVDFDDPWSGMKRRAKEVYKGCTIVKVRYVQEDVETFPIGDLFKQVEKAKKERQKKAAKKTKRTVQRGIEEAKKGLFVPGPDVRAHDRYPCL
jgi:hypothetical protein